MPRGTPHDRRHELGRPASGRRFLAAAAGRFLAAGLSCKPTRARGCTRAERNVTEQTHFETTQRANRRSERSQDRPRPIRDIRRELKAINPAGARPHKSDR